MKEWWSVAHVLHEEEKLPVSRVCRRCGRSTVVYYKGRKTRARLANREDFILLLARRERIVNPMAACEKVLYAIRPAMAAEGVSMGVNRFYRLMKANGMMVSETQEIQLYDDDTGQVARPVFEPRQGQHNCRAFSQAEFNKAP